MNGLTQTHVHKQTNKLDNCLYTITSFFKASHSSILPQDTTLTFFCSLFLGQFSHSISFVLNGSIESCMNHVCPNAQCPIAKATFIELGIQFVLRNRHQYPTAGSQQLVTFRPQRSIQKNANVQKTHKTRGLHRLKKNITTV